MTEGYPWKAYFYRRMRPMAPVRSCPACGARPRLAMYDHDGREIDRAYVRGRAGIGDGRDVAGDEGGWLYRNLNAYADSYAVECGLCGTRMDVRRRPTAYEGMAAAVFRWNRLGEGIPL